MGRCDISPPLRPCCSSPPVAAEPAAERCRRCRGRARLTRPPTPEPPPRPERPPRVNRPSPHRRTRRPRRRGRPRRRLSKRSPPPRPRPRRRKRLHPRPTRSPTGGWRGTDGWHAVTCRPGSASRGSPCPARPAGASSSRCGRSTRPGAPAAGSSSATAAAASSPRWRGASRTRNAASEALAAVATVEAIDCFGKQNARGSAPTLKYLGADTLDFPTVGDETVAYRGDYKLEGDTAVGDYIFVRTGRVLTAAAFQNAGGAPKQSTVKAVLERVVARIRDGE